MPRRNNQPPPNPPKTPNTITPKASTAARASTNCYSPSSLNRSGCIRPSLCQCHKWGVALSNCPDNIPPFSLAGFFREPASNLIITEVKPNPPTGTETNIRTLGDPVADDPGNRMCRPVNLWFPADSPGGPGEYARTDTRTYDRRADATVHRCSRLRNGIPVTGTVGTALPAACRNNRRGSGSVTLGSKRRRSPAELLVEPALGLLSRAARCVLGW